jgi:NAD(P)-dependent dehydrogenase (short-subunit alcohol dehydrogenase family)
MRLKDKVAIITAAGSGAGRAGAVIFAKEGAKVVVGDIDPEGGKETVKMIKDGGGEATFVEMDVGKIDHVRRLIDTTADTYGKINILWNHAGVPGPSRLEDTKEVDLDRSWDINYKGGFFAVKFVAPHMKKAGGGSIIFTGSVGAFRGTAASASYPSFKGAVVSLTWTLAVTLAPHNIRVNCICPGFIESPMGRVFVNRSGSLAPEAVDKVIQDLAKKSPMGRNARPEDIGKVALFLASDDAAYVNGVILPVDGGGSLPL